MPVHGDECDAEALSLACDLTLDSKGKGVVQLLTRVAAG